MWRVCDRLRADSRSSFNFIRAATACIVTAARVQLSTGWFAFGFHFYLEPPPLALSMQRDATVFGMIRVCVSILLGQPPLEF